MRVRGSWRYAGCSPASPPPPGRRSPLARGGRGRGAPGSTTRRRGAWPMRCGSDSVPAARWRSATASSRAVGSTLHRVRRPRAGRSAPGSSGYGPGPTLADRASRCLRSRPSTAPWPTRSLPQRRARARGPEGTSRGGEVRSALDSLLKRYGGPPVTENREAGKEEGEETGDSAWERDAAARRNRSENEDLHYVGPDPLLQPSEIE